MCSQTETCHLFCDVYPRHPRFQISTCTKRLFLLSPTVITNGKLLHATLINIQCAEEEHTHEKTAGFYDSSQDDNGPPFARKFRECEECLETNSTPSTLRLNCAPILP